MKKHEMVMHEYYNFKNQPEKLMYIGNNFSGNGYWHQSRIRTHRPEGRYVEPIGLEYRDSRWYYHNENP